MRFRCFAFLTGGWPRYHLSCAIASWGSWHAASPALHFNAMAEGLCQVSSPHPHGPHNVATEPPDANSTHGRSFSANCPHREGTHSISKLRADAMCTDNCSVAKCSYRMTELHTYPVTNLMAMIQMRSPGGGHCDALMHSHVTWECLFGSNWRLASQTRVADGLKPRQGTWKESEALSKLSS